MESIEISSNAVSLDSVICFTIDLINAGQTLAAWAGPRVLAIEEYIGEAFYSLLGADPMDRAALAAGGTIDIPILKDHPNLSEFDNRVGQSMVLAHLRWGRRIPDLEYQRIAVAADQQGWKPLRHLEEPDATPVAGMWAWNQLGRGSSAALGFHTFNQSDPNLSKENSAPNRINCLLKVLCRDSLAH